jgi:hypothetical protein
MSARWFPRFLRHVLPSNFDERVLCNVPVSFFNPTVSPFNAMTPYAPVQIPLGHPCSMSEVAVGWRMVKERNQQPCGRR